MAHKELSELKLVYPSVLYYLNSSHVCYAYAEVSPSDLNLAHPLLSQDFAFVIPVPGALYFLKFPWLLASYH